MKNLKPFNEMRNSNIHTGIELTPRQINYICDDISKKYLEDFEILVDDGIFYVKLSDIYWEFELWEFDRIQDVRDFIHLRYYIDKNRPNEALEIIKRNKNLDYSFHNNWPIRWASYCGQTEIVELLLQDKRVDPSDNNNSAIKWASQYGHTEIVKLLLSDPRVDPSCDNNWPIRLASDQGHTEIFNLLLQDKRVDPSDEDNMAIKWAIERGHNEIVRLLIQHPKVRAKLTKKEIEYYEKY